MLDTILQHATKDHAVQLYAVRNGNFRNCAIERVTTQGEVDFFLASHKDRDIYFNVALMEASESGRGDETKAKVLPWLFADIDCAGGKHSGNRPTKEAVAEYLKSGQIPMPTYVVDSGGGGFHCYWKFAEPLTDMAVASAAQVALNEQIATWMADNKYKYEKLSGLARVFRVPGSVNYKYGNPAVVIYSGEGNYRVEDFPVADTHVSDAPVVLPTDFDETRAAHNALSAIQKVPLEWNPDGDGSGYVIRLMRQCVRHGVSAQTAVRLVQVQLSTLPDFPGKYTAKQLADRYADATKESDLGSAFVPEIPKNEYEFARFIAEKTENGMFYVPDWRNWLNWDGRKFSQDTMKPLLDLIYDNSISLSAQIEDKAFAKFLLRYTTRAGMSDIERLLRELKTAKYESFDTNPNEFFVSNGCLEFRQDGTVALRPHNKLQMNTKISDAVYVPGATCPRWDYFVRETFVDAQGKYDDSLAKYMQKLSGYVLTGRIDLQHFWILHGSGQNGKGAYTRTMLKVLGSYGISIDQGTMTGDGDDFGVVQLFRSRAAFAQETDQDCRLNEHRIKLLTGGDRMAARRLYENWWEFEPTHKLFLSTNYIPMIRGSDNGIWRRVRIVPFNASPSRDSGMEEAFSQELSGILNWCLEGYRMLQTEGLHEPEIISTTVREHKEDMNIVRQFVEDMCVLEPSATITTRELYMHLSAYCHSLGQYKPSIRKMNDELKRLGVTDCRSKTERFKVGICRRELD